MPAMDLSKEKCTPCEGGVPPLSADKINALLREVNNWNLDGNKIAKQFKFKDFMQAKTFIDKVADIAENEGHHPDIHWVYNKITITLWTHAAGGLTENDFILAAKIDNIASRYHLVGLL